MFTAHQYQSIKCSQAQKPILNAASKEDPAYLGQQYGAINLDISTVDPPTGLDLHTVPNFIEGNVLQMTMFEDKKFSTVVLGEFLEHCVFDTAVEALLEIKRVLKDNGLLIITFPLDDRPPEAQHAKRFLYTVWPGKTGHDITTFHQTVWEEDSLNKLLSQTGWKLLEKEELFYSFLSKKPNGFGLILEKIS